MRQTLQQVAVRGGNLEEVVAKFCRDPSNQIFTVSSPQLNGPLEPDCYLRCFCNVSSLKDDKEGDEKNFIVLALRSTLSSQFLILLSDSAGIQFGISC